MEFDAEMKVWTSNDHAHPMIKSEMVADIMGNKMENFVELTGTGNKAD